eukprot:m.486580 g.486580  ORF g.486580 m.486580 type:complete len:213 (+) comp24506_c0_seq1:157-795(+)
MMRPEASYDDALVSLVRSDTSVEAARSATVTGFRLVPACAQHSKYVTYTIDVACKGKTSTICRRFSQFRRLHDRLRTECPSVVLKCPKKRRVRNNFAEEFLQGRLVKLQQFLQEVLANPLSSKQLCVYTFLYPSDAETAGTALGGDSDTDGEGSDSSRSRSASLEALAVSVEEHGEGSRLAVPNQDSAEAVSPAKLSAFDTGTLQVRHDSIS